MLPNTKSGLEIYSEKLIKEGIVTTEDVKSVRDKYEKICEEAMELAKKETHIKVGHDYMFSFVVHGIADLVKSFKLTCFGLQL